MTEQTVLPVKPTDNFSDLEWSALCAELEPIAKVLASYAKGHALSFRTDTRWPLARLVKRRGLSKRSVSLQLAKDFVDTRHVSWELIYHQWVNVWVFFYKPGEVKVITKYSTEQLKAKSVISEVLALAESRLLQANGAKAN